MKTYLGDGVREVGEEWDVEPAEAALLARRVHPRQVREVRVHRACDHLRTVNKGSYLDIDSENG